MKSIYLCDLPEKLTQVYAPRERARVESLTESLGAFVGADECPDAELAFSTWGMPALDERALETRFPNLKAVFYAAGSVQGFARPLLGRGIRLFSAWQANAVPVAQYVFAQILLAAKGYFQVQPANRVSRPAALALFARYPGNYEAKVGLIGCGAIGKRVCEMLRHTDLETLVCDPYLPDETAKSLGARKVSLEELFETCDVISNHLPNLPATVGLVTRAHFASMKPRATFINTGRGPQIDEEGLRDALVAQPGRTALIDVMTDEGNSVQNPLNLLSNCLITPHIAGSAGNEVHRMAAYMADECERMLRGEPCLYEVTEKMLETMA